jgi:hypothetical protein
VIAAPKLRRAVVRVPEELLGELADVARRLREETGLEHSGAAVVRGLLVIGLDAIAGREHLAPSFAGARVKRGAKRGARLRLDQGDDTGEGGRR